MKQAVWLVAAIIVLGVTYTLGWYAGRGDTSVRIERHVDTVFYQSPAPRAENFRQVSISVPKLMFAPADTVTQTTIVEVGTDSVKMHLAIETREYSDSTYIAQVSGPRVGEYRPRLDWLKQTNTTSVVEVRVPGPKRKWGIGVQVGYGAVLKQDVRLYPYVGVGISYHLIGW